MPAFDAVGMDAVGVSGATSAVVVSLIAANSTETSTSSTGAATITPASNTVNLIAAGSTETPTSGTGAATVTPAAPGLVNLVTANSTETPTSSTGAATVTPAPKTVNLTPAPSTETPTSGTGAATVAAPVYPVNPAMLYAMPGSGWNFPDMIAGDVATLSFDFKDEIPAGVTILSAAAHPVVHVGVDPNPAALIAGDPTVNGSIVSVRAHAFVAGCAYWPRVTAALSDGQAITYPLPGEGSLRVVA